MNQKSYNNFFINFANRTKLGIIMALKDGPLSVSEIAKRVKGEQSAISHNLRKLKMCHILDVRKEGRERFYLLNKDTVMPMLKLAVRHVRKHCSGGCCK